MSNTKSTHYIPKQDPIQIYARDCEIIIEQERSDGSDPDIVMIAPENVAKLVKALQALSDQFQG